MTKTLFNTYLRKSILIMTTLVFVLGLALVPGESPALADPPEPYLVKDIRPGVLNSIGDGEGRKTAVNSTLFLMAYDGVHGDELWKSDGTSEGTMMVKDINPESSSRPSQLTDFKGTLFFQADDGVHGGELWKSDGSEADTVLIKDIFSGSEQSDPWRLTNINGTLFFTAKDGVHGWELWKSDGTLAGTVMIKDINPGIEDSYPGIWPGSWTEVNGTLFFTANDGVHGWELWKSDGTTEGTVMVKDIFSGEGQENYIESLTNVDGTLFFTADDGMHGKELWKSDGTEAGTVMVKDLIPGEESSVPLYLTEVNGTLFFEFGTAQELWKSDGSEVGTVQVYGGLNIFALINVNGMLFINADDGVHGIELWKSDGTPSGTVIVKDINSGLGDAFYHGEVEWNNIESMLFFSADDGIIGTELWKSDGTESGTVLVKDINTGSADSNPQKLTIMNGNLFFDANDGVHGRELWALHLPQELSLFLPLVTK